MSSSFSLRPVRGEDADPLFPLIFRTAVTDSILWNGPENLEAYRAALKEKEELTRRGEAHMFTLFSGDSPAGSCSFRPYEDGYRADIGLWIGEPHQGRGLGTFAVGELVRYGFQRPEIRKVEASVFVGNASSRRIFEKNGFRVEGTIRLCCRKRERLLDEWLLGITREEYER